VYEQGEEVNIGRNKVCSR